MAIRRERENGHLPIIPDLWEEGLTPQIPGRGVPDFQALPEMHFDPAAHADVIINRPLSKILNEIKIK